MTSSSQLTSSHLRKPVFGLLLLTCSCANEVYDLPQATRIEPAAVDQAQGAAVVVEGQNFRVRMVSDIESNQFQFDDGFQISLISQEAEGSSLSLEAVTLLDSDRLEAAVPAGVSPGQYGLLIGGPFGTGLVSEVMLTIFSDLDQDMVHDNVDPCVDVDGDGLGRQGFDTSGCLHLSADSDDADANLCADTNTDGCDDCSSGSFVPASDGCEVWAVASCAKRIALDITNNGSEDLARMPVAVTLTPQRIEYTDAAIDGSDVRFHNGQGTRLSHEIESWNPAAESVLWLSVPNLVAMQTTLVWMYYGCGDAVAETPEQVWQDYTAVWHMNEALVDGQTSGTVFDSTTAHNGNQSGTAGGTGKLAGGQVLVPNDTTIVADAPALDLSGAMTISAWIQVPIAPVGYRYIVSKYNIANDRAYALYLFDMQPRFVISADGTDTDVFVQSSSNLVPGSWHYVTGTWDGTAGAAALEIYVDGVMTGQDAGPVSPTIHNSATNLEVGCARNGVAFIGCIRANLDELRIASGRRSVSWILAQFQSMQDSLISYGAAEDRP